LWSSDVINVFFMFEKFLIGWAPPTISYCLPVCMLISVGVVEDAIEEWNDVG